MDEVNKIKKAFRDGESINQIAERFRRSWATIKKVVDGSLDDLEKKSERVYNSL